MPAIFLLAQKKTPGFYSRGRHEGLDSGLKDSLRQQSEIGTARRETNMVKAKVNQRCRISVQDRRSNFHYPIVNFLTRQKIKILYVGRVKCLQGVFMGNIGKNRYVSNSR